MNEPVFTQKLMMHLNGGKKYSSLVYNVYRDGKPTGIVRTRNTNGSPKYKITTDILQKEDDEFDILNTPIVDGKCPELEAWLLAHSEPATKEKSHEAT